MKKVLTIIAISCLCLGCQMNPSKEARISKLENEMKSSIERIEELEKEAISLKAENTDLKAIIEDIQNK